MWHLIPEANKLPHHLVNVPLKDSPLSDCGGLCGDLDIQIKLEDNVSLMLVVGLNELVTVLLCSHDFLLFYLALWYRVYIQIYLW